MIVEVFALRGFLISLIVGKKSVVALYIIGLPSWLSTTGFLRFWFHSYGNILGNVFPQQSRYHDPFPHWIMNSSFFSFTLYHVKQFHGISSDNLARGKKYCKFAIV